jgi:hypothetical protein
MLRAVKWMGAVGVSGLFLVSGLASAQENYSSWTYYKNITLNTQASGAAVSNTVTAFPVLVRLTSADSAIFRSASGHGQDIRFSKWDGTHFPYQIERWDSVNMRAEMWVLVDTVKGSDSAQAAYPNGYAKMFWGKTGAFDSSNPGKVFDTANGYQAAWHLGEATGAVGADATVNGYAITPGAKGTGVQPVDTEGMIGRAKCFAGDLTGGANGGQYVTTMADPTVSKVNFDNRALYTLSAWVLSDTFPTTSSSGLRRTVMQKGNGSGSPGDYNLVGMYGSATQGYWQGGDYQTSTPYNEWQPANATPHVWQHIVFTRATNGNASGDMNMYVNGVLANGTWSSSANTTNIRSDIYQVAIGSSSDGTRFFHGIIDEAEISSVSRSADWVKLSFQNQQKLQTLVVAGSIQQNATQPPVLSMPGNGAPNQPVALTLGWSAASGALSYEVQVSTTTDFSTTVLDQSGITGTSQPLTGLSAKMTYYWRANATGITLSAWSGTWSFQTIAPWSAPTLTSPTNGAVSQPVSPLLVWGGVSGAASYTVQVSQNSGFSSTVFSQGGVTGFSQTVGPLSYISSYYWRVNAYDGTSQTSAWSSVWTFSTRLPLPATPVLSSPTTGATGLATSLTLAWGNATMATSYNLQLSADSLFGTTLISQSGLTATTAAVSNLAAGTTYYWRVVGVNAGGPGLWSAAWNFATQPTSAVLHGAVNAAVVGFAVKGEKIVYSLKSAGSVEITFSDLLGRTALVINRTQSAGSYTMALRDYALASGRYIVQFRAAGVEKRSMIMISRQ